MVGAAYVLGWRPAGLLLVLAVAALVAVHVLGAVLLYRRTMRRPWPRVRPLEDDDDW